MSSFAQPILDSISTAVLWFDTTLHLQEINSAGESLFRVSAKQAKGLPGWALFREAEHFMRSLERALQEGHPLTEHEMRVHLADGTKITVDYTVTPVTETHAATGLVVEFLQVDQQLRFSREEHMLSQHQAALHMLRGLAHEIKNPLGGLRGAAQLLARQLATPDLREYTDIIILEADRLQKLLDEMLGPRNLPEKQSFNVHVVLCRVRQLLLSEHPQRIQIINDFDPSLPEVLVDPNQLHQIVLNIMRNAIQAMDGAGEITLTTRIQRSYRVAHQLHRLAVRIDISDTGPGIPEDLQEQIFYPMVSGRTGGTGLGLSIAQNLTKNNGGAITCNSRPGQTVFSLYFPVEKTNHAETRPNLDY